MIVYNNTSGSTGKIKHSSKGNQLKMNVGDKWYKADFLGYEGAAEYVASEILKKSNVPEFVSYEMCLIQYNGAEYNGCVSDSFLHTDEKIIPIERLFRAHYDKTIMQITENMILEDKIKYIVDKTEDITGLDSFGKYLTMLLEFDAIILNEDRHYKNIAVIQKKDGSFRYCPVFDNGASFLSDTRMDYPLEKNEIGLIADVQAKPFDKKFDKQVEMCEKLYGKVLQLKDMRNLPEKVINKVKEHYGEKIAQRIDTVYNRQHYIYKEYFTKNFKKEKNIETDKSISMQHKKRR